MKIVELSTLKTDTLVKLLQSEIDLLKVIKHPNVLHCYEVLSSTNNCYIVTEYCSGGDLETRLQKQGALSEREFRRIVWESYQGLRYLAGLNIIHRDFKIANIFLSNGVAKLADFGFAQRLRHAEERFTDVNIGSPVYMAPEAMIENLYGPKTDVWAFGIFVYELLHGDTPLGYCETEEELFEGVRTQLTAKEINPTVSAQLRDLILKCLQVDERRRISVAQIGREAYMLELEAEFAPERTVRDANRTILVPSKQFESVRTTENNPRVSLSHLNIPQQHRSLSHLTIGPSIASQLVMGSNDTQSRMTQLSSVVPSTNSQIVLLGNRNSTQGLITQTVIHPQMQNSAIKHPQTLSFTKQGSRPYSQTLTTTMNRVKPQTYAPTNLIRSKISFSQCVQLLHYCRLIHKCVTAGTKITSCAKVVDYLSGWLLALTEELKLKCLTFVQFDGERAPLREKKLGDLVEEYYAKYRNELKTTVLNPGHSGIYLLIKESLAVLDRDIHLAKSQFEVDVMVRAALLLAALYEINAEVEKASESGDFSRLGSLKMDEFLNRPNESFSIDSYNHTKARMASLFR